MKRVIMGMLALSLLCIFLVGCDENENSEATSAASSIQATDQSKTAENFERLYVAVPPPELATSQERINLVKRLERFNVADKISYIYLVSYGKIMANYVVRGKVSSVNSMLTCTEQIVDDGQGHYAGRSNVHTVASPDLDGSYGSNGDAIFFFTDQDIYVEWSGEYMLCDQPLRMEQPPELVMSVDK